VKLALREIQELREILEQMPYGILGVSLFQGITILLEM